MGTRLIWLQPNAGNGQAATWLLNPNLGLARGVRGGQVWQAWRDLNWDDPWEGFQGNPVSGYAYGRWCGLARGPADGRGCTYSQYAPNRTQGANYHAWVQFDDPPTLVSFDRVKFFVRWDYSARPSNPYVFPEGIPDGTGGPFGDQTNAWGPRTRIMFRNRARNGWLYSPTWYYAGWKTGGYPPSSPTGTPVNGNHYCHINRYRCENRQAVYGAHSKAIAEWELTSHPEGGPFTFEDLRTIVAGVHSQCQRPAWYQYGPVAFVRVRFFHYYIEAEISDPGAFVDPLRQATSHSLRISRRPRNAITVQTPAREANRELGEVGFLSHPRGLAAEGDGWPEPRLLRRPAQLLQRTFWPESLKVEDEHLDLHDIRCTAWAAFRIGIPWSPELSGMAFLDQGGGFVHDRLQDAWTIRSGDRVLTRVPQKPAPDIERPALSEDGLACSGPGDHEVGAKNTDPKPGVSGWVLNSPASLTVTDDTTAQIAEELGYERSQRLVYGAGGTGLLQQNYANGWGPGAVQNIRVRCRNVAVPNPTVDFLELEIFRWNVALARWEWFNPSTFLWQTGAVYIPLPSTGPVGEVVFDGIPVDLPGLGNYWIRAGRHPTRPIPNGGTFILGLFSKQLSSPTTVSTAHRPENATLASTITRLGETWTQDNSGAATFWHRDRGAAFFEFRPYWRTDLMANATVKPIARAQNVGNGFDQVSLISSVAGPDTMQFDRWTDALVLGSTVSVPVLDGGGSTLRVTRDHIVRVFVSWNGTEGGNLEAPFQVTIGVAVFNANDGSFVSWNSATAPGAAMDGTEDEFLLGHDPSPRYLDAWMRTFEVKRNPILGLESAWRR